MTQPTLEQRLKSKIRKSSRSVFLRKDFESLGGYDQVGRALRHLVEQGRLVKVGQGLYAKARPNRVTGKPMLSAPGGFDQVSKEALRLLNIDWRPARSENRYQAGSTQIPANTVVYAQKGLNRTIAYGPYKLTVQNSIRQRPAIQNS